MKFKTDLYKKHTWLAGCSEQDLVYCFWCTITKQKSTNWSTTGITNMCSIEKTITKHVVSKRHTTAEFDFTNLGKINIINMLDATREKNEIQRTILQDRNVRYTICIFRTVLLF